MPKRVCESDNSKLFSILQCVPKRRQLRIDRDVAMDLALRYTKRRKHKYLYSKCAYEESFGNLDK